MAYASRVGSSSGGGRGNLLPELPGTSNNSSAKSLKTKRQSHKNRAYSLQDKENIVTMIESGARNIEIVRKLNCPESTVRNIKRNLVEIKKSISLAKKYFGSDGNAKRAMKDKGDRNRFVLLTCNASGDYLMKPLVIYKYKRPRAYKGCDMNKLNVYWEQTKKGYMSTELSRKWFDECFVKDAKKYCQKKNVAFKVVLFLDNAPSHAKFLVGRHPAVEVVFLPPNTTSKIQPLDQEIIANVKLLYYKYVHDKMRKETDKQEELKEVDEDVSSSSEEETQHSPLSASPTQPPLRRNPHTPSTSTPLPTASASTSPPGIVSNLSAVMTITAFWKKFNILQAVNFLVNAWNNITLATVRHGWSALLPHLKSAETERRQTADLMNEVLKAVRNIPAPGFEEVNREDLEEMLRDGDATGSVDDILDEEDSDDGGDAASEAEEHEQRKVTTQKLSHILGVCTSLHEMIQDIGESEQGEKEKMIGFVNQISRNYQKHYNDRMNDRQQSLITRFLSQCRPAQEQEIGMEEDEEIDDIGELPDDFDFTGLRKC
ncbi:hypothetical protein Pcinc_007470 [Petrolisthes cinctipes]|uniref:DDE-1 domain-containing protein n=1 Tax=Petrolisthes cinctipes TaxID=88211 RepID=A0AAE1GAS0_PETCI|nr:hypothetical protein Pcinc_007470 [Petrolisthes cinctipes]